VLVVLPDENPEEFDSFRKDLLASLAPQGELELMWADRIVCCAWRLRRVPKHEALIYRRTLEERILEMSQQEIAQYAMTASERIDLSVQGKTVKPEDREAHSAAEKRAQLARTKLAAPPLEVARALQLHWKPLSNLSRYEVGLNRNDGAGTS
jgi:hypothetical protein